MRETIHSPKFHIRGQANSERGGRPENQDNYGFLETPLGFLVVVCDGMGGGPSGRHASEVAVMQIRDYVFKASPDADRLQVLKSAVDMAETALEDEMRQHPQMQGMGSTMTAVLINEQSAFIAHMGDSRVYRLKGRRVMHRTDDHSLVAQLVRNHTMSEESARTSPQSNVITRALGSTGSHLADIAEVPYCKGDRFVLCSDGIWGIMPHEQLLARLTARKDVVSIVNDLSAEVDKIGFAGGGGHDNHTLVIIETETDSKLKDKMNTLSKIIIAVLGVLLGISLIFNLVSLLGAKSTGAAASEGQLVALQAENSELKSKLDQLEESLKRFIENDKSEYREYYLQLKNQERAYQDSIDHLRGAIARLEASRAEDRGVRAATPVATPGEAKSIAGSIVAKLKEMKEVTGKSEPNLLESKSNCRNTVLNLLHRFDEATGARYSSEVNAISQELCDKGHTSAVCMLIYPADDKGVYRSTDKAKKNIDEIIKKVEALAAKL